MISHHTLDDGLFEALWHATMESEKGPMTGLELYERRGALLEITEDGSGLRSAAVEERGFALRIFRGGRVAFAAAPPSGTGRLLSGARIFLPRIRARRGFRAPAPGPGEETRHLPLGHPAITENAPVLEVMAAFRQHLATASRGAATLLEVTTLSGERRERIATSAGRAASWESTSATLIATVLGKSGGERFSARILATAPHLSELPVARMARIGADRVLLPLTGRKAPAGSHDIILDPHVAGHVIGRLAPLFFGDSQDHLIAAWTKDGKTPLTSPVLSLVDSPDAPRGAFRSARDGEGTPVRRTVLVEKGRVIGRLTDVAAANRLDALPTGNAVRMAWSTEPEIGITNFFVDPVAGTSPVDLVNDMKRGIYAAVLLERPDVDLAGDSFRIVASGYLIEKGRSAERLSEITIAGTLSHLLTSVKALGDDLKFVTAPGGSAGCPSLFIPKWKIP